jgi:hypothetical protein
MEAICSSETSVQFTRSTRRHISEDGILRVLISFGQAISPCGQYLWGSGPRLMIPSGEKCGHILISSYRRNKDRFKGAWKSLPPQIQECGFLLYRTKPDSLLNWSSKVNLWYSKENRKRRCSNQCF